MLLVIQVLQDSMETQDPLGLLALRVTLGLQASGTQGRQVHKGTLVLQGPQVLTDLQEILVRQVLLEDQGRQGQQGLLVQSVVASPWIWMTHTQIMSLEGNFMPSIATTLQPRTSMAP